MLLTHVKNHNNTLFYFLLIIFILLSVNCDLIPELNQSPIADFYISRIYEGGQKISTLKVRFNAINSYDIDGEIVRYEWDFGDGTSDAYEKDPTAYHIYEEEKTYIVQLIVTDDDDAQGSSKKQIDLKLSPTILTSNALSYFLSNLNGEYANEL